MTRRLSTALDGCPPRLDSACGGRQVPDPVLRQRLITSTFRLDVSTFFGIRYEGSVSPSHQNGSG